MLWMIGSSLADAGGSADRLTTQWAGGILDSLDDNPRLVAGEAIRKMASADVDSARQPIYEPQLGLEWKQRGAQSAAANFEVFVAQQIDLAGKSEARSRRLESGSLAAGEDYRLIRQELLQDILNASAERWTTARLVEVARTRESRTAEFLRLLKKNQKAGTISEYEVDTGYLRLADAVGMLAQAEEIHLQSTFRFSELTGGAAVPDYLPIDHLHPIEPAGDLERKVNHLAPVAAARARFESSRAAVRAVDAERSLDPTLGLIAGKDENDRFIGVNVTIPLALRASSAPFREASQQAALAEEQRYLESFRRAESRLKGAEAVYRKLFGRWKQWNALASGRTDPREELLQRMWDAGQISSDDYFVIVRDRQNAAATGIRLSGRVWTAWIEWLAASGELEAWLRELAGSRDSRGQE